MRDAARRAVAVTELLLVSPAALFIAALFVRSTQSPALEPARTANRIVMWYVGLGPRVGLWGLLIALPGAVLGLGVVTVCRDWTSDTGLRQAARQAGALLRQHTATAIVTATAVMAAGILAIVALHVLTN